MRAYYHRPLDFRSHGDVLKAPYLKALIKEHHNGFFARQLDPDDFDFLDHVKRCGIANGQEASDRGFLIEELEYWHLPYAIDHSVDRRVGPFKPEEIVPDAVAEARRERRKQDRILNAQEKAATQAAWEEEQERQAREREQRLKQTMQADIEWDDAHARQFSNLHEDSDSNLAPAEPPPRYQYSPAPPKSSRHYVPYWKREQLAMKEEPLARAEAAETEKALLASAKRREAAERAELQAKQALEALQKREYAEAVAAAAQRAKAKFTEQELAKRAELRAQYERAEREWKRRRKAAKRRIERERAAQLAQKVLEERKRWERIQDQNAMSFAEKVERTAIAMKEIEVTRREQKRLDRRFYSPLKAGYNWDHELDHIIENVEPEPEPVEE
jgi:hypothetical protein